MSETKPVTIGQSRQFESKILGDTRQLMIATPPGYLTDPERRFPVLYVLDGPGHFEYVVGMVRFLAGLDRIPGLFVVAVGNTDRTRDLTPPSQVETEVDASPTHGGAYNFLEFLTEELIPWVDGTYRTHPYRILTGHSFGGLFAIHTLVTKPHAFDAYIAISPSLWWNAQALVTESDAFFKQQAESKQGLTKDLYMTMGNEGGAMLGGARKLAGILDELAPDDFRWDFRWMDEETHGSIPLKSTYQGLEAIFGDWALPKPLPLFDQGGVAAIDRYFTEAGARSGLQRELPAATLHGLAHMLIGADRLEDVEAVLDYDTDRFPPPPQVLEGLAGAYRKRDEPAMAAKHLRQLLERHPGSPNAREQLSELGEAVPEPPQVDLSQEQKLAVTGTYRMGRDFDVVITLEAGKLSYLAPMGEKLEMLAIAVDRFYFADSYQQLQSHCDESGKIASLTSTDGFSTSRARRIE